jgi:glycosyltransferase involved in cell wall biosynthesis
MIGHAARRADRVITVSEQTRRDLLRFFPVAPEKVETVYNGVEPVFFTSMSAEERDARLQRLGLEPGYLLFVANPKPHKNLERVLRALARAAAGVSGLLVCAGDPGPPSRPFRRLAAELGVGERVRFLGRVTPDELRALYQGARLLLFPSLYEGFGLPLVEAMASGTPVLTSNDGALAEIAGDAAELVDPRDVAAIAAGLIRGLDPQRAAELSARGHERARSFDWRRSAASTLATYRRVLGEAA